MQLPQLHNTVPFTLLLLFTWANATQNTTTQWTEELPNRQCIHAKKYTNDQPYQPTFAKFQTTLPECKTRCESSSDARQRPCVAIEWEHHGPHGAPMDASAVSVCNLAYGCSRLNKWDSGSVYMLEEYYNVNIRDDVRGLATLSVVIQMLIGGFAACVLVAAFQQYRRRGGRTVHAGRNGGNRNGRAAHSNGSSTYRPSTHVVLPRHPAMVMLASDVVKQKRRGSEKEQGCAGEQDGDATTLVVVEMRDIGLEGKGKGGEEARKNGDTSAHNCFICLEPALTCSTCVCHIAVHDSCLTTFCNTQREGNKDQGCATRCSVCKQEFGSGV